MELRLEVKEQAMNEWPGMTHYLVDTSGLPQNIFTNSKCLNSICESKKEKEELLLP